MGVGVRADLAAQRQDLPDNTAGSSSSRLSSGRRRVGVGWIVADVDVVRSDEIVLLLPLLQDRDQLCRRCQDCPGPPPAGDTSAGNLRLVHVHARGNDAGVTRRMQRHTWGGAQHHLWMASDSRLLSPSRAWVAKCTLVAPPTVVSTTPGSVPTPATFWLTRTSRRHVTHGLVGVVADTAVGLDDLARGVALHDRVVDVGGGDRHVAAVAAVETWLRPSRVCMLA